MTCFCFTFVSRSFWTLELTRRRNLKVSSDVSMFGSRATVRSDWLSGEKEPTTKGLFAGKTGLVGFWCLGTSEELVFI